MRKKVTTDETKLLSTLADVTLALDGARSPRAGLQRALEILTPLYGVVRASVVLADADTGRLKIEASEGVTSAGRKATWKLGEGITGRVVQTGRPVVVPQISQEPMFLNRTGPRQKSGKSKITFICLPIRGERKAIGALNVDLPFIKDRDYEHDLQLFDQILFVFFLLFLPQLIF